MTQATATKSAPSATVRSVARIVTGQPTSDGAGVRLTRVIGTQALPNLDPFLMLDEFRSDKADDYLAGFPDHPHRGFETVTYMLAGRMRHGDHMGNVGLLGPGSVQWMTAGRGIVHSEMPEQQDGLMWGFQLWVNLPAKDKMTAPRYQDIPGDKVPDVEIPGGRVRLITGTVGGVSGPVTGVATDPIYLDVALDANARFEHAVPATHAGFVYAYENDIRVGDREVKRGQLAVLSDGDVVNVAASNTPARFILVAGRPLKEPIVQYGPFVMNTKAEIIQAVEDFQAGRF